MGSESQESSQTSIELFIVKTKIASNSYLLLLVFFRRSERERWIREKYEQKLYLPPLTLNPSQIKTNLIDAIHQSDLYTVILILAHRKLTTDDLNSSLLHLAASQGNVTIVQLLLWVRQKSFSFVFLELFSFFLRRFSTASIHLR